MTGSADSQTESAAPRPDSPETRRAALARMGRLAGCTAPAMLALLGATTARAQANGSEGRPGGGSVGI